MFLFPNYFHMKSIISRDVVLHENYKFDVRQVIASYTPAS